MATCTPHLDNFTSSIDALPYSLDSALLLTRVDWSNPTLEQLDAWGDMDSLDTFGTLEQLANLDVIHAPGSADIAITATGAIQFAIQFDASVNISVSTTGEAQRIQHMTASVTGAASATATASFTAKMDGAASVAVTVAGASTPVRGFRGAAGAARAARAGAILVDRL